MKRWAVIGASSFSGKAFCRYLRRQNENKPEHPVVEVEELSRPFYDLNKRIALYEDALMSLRPDYIVNFAALNMVAESWTHYADYYRTNVIGVARLAERVAKMDFVKRFVQVSTPEVYGQQQRFLREDAPFNPSTPYAVSRAAIDQHLMAMHRTHKFPVSFTRSVNVYGPDQQPYRIIPKTVLKILRGEQLELHGGGQSSRSFIHIDDVAESIYFVATRGRAGEAYHTSTKTQTTISELVHKICFMLDAKPKDVIKVVEDRPGKDMAYQLDASKIKLELAWEPRTPFAIGLQMTVKWWKENSDKYSGIPLEYQHKG